jgi:cytochrome c oxidase cbb3-type subunit III
MPEEKDELLDHNYDGIQEYDNDLPRWWLWLFYLTIAISVVYYFYFDISGAGKFPVEKLDQQMAALKEVQKNTAPVVASLDTEEKLLAFASGAEAVSKGKELYATNCAVCHQPEGGGLIGPNLTDDNWIHGGKITEIKRIIEVGVLEKGMLAWQGVLPPEQLDQVVAYVWALHGTNPPNPKAPEGPLAPRH